MNPQEQPEKSSQEKIDTVMQELKSGHVPSMLEGKMGEPLSGPLPTDMISDESMTVEALCLAVYMGGLASFWESVGPEKREAAQNDPKFDGLAEGVAEAAGLHLADMVERIDQSDVDSWTKEEYAGTLVAEIYAMYEKIIQRMSQY